MKNIMHILNRFPRYLDDEAWTYTIDMRELVSRFDSWMDRAPESITLRISWIKK